MFGIEPWKFMIIVVAALFLVPSDKLPEIARTIGKFVRMFNEARKDMEATIKADMFVAEDTTKVFTDTTQSVASTLYGHSPVTEDDDEEGEEE